MKKHDAIDLVKLYSTFTASEWNAVLTKAHREHDLRKMAQLRYQLQAGMRDLAAKKMNTEKMIHWWIRLQTSIENTMKLILREKQPNPCDNPKTAGENMHLKQAKKDRDHELELFLKRSGY